jgi:hypothetical protein
LPPGRFLVLISAKGCVDPRVIVRLEGLRQLKNPVTLSGIELVIFRLVAKKKPGYILLIRNHCAPSDPSVTFEQVSRLYVTVRNHVIEGNNSIVVFIFKPMIIAV